MPGVHLDTGHLQMCAIPYGRDKSGPYGVRGIYAPTVAISPPSRAVRGAMLLFTMYSSGL
jgi:hypothetical protein